MNMVCFPIYLHFLHLPLAMSYGFQDHSLLVFKIKDLCHQTVICLGNWVLLLLLIHVLWLMNVEIYKLFDLSILGFLLTIAQSQISRSLIWPWELTNQAAAYWALMGLWNQEHQSVSLEMGEVVISGDFTLGWDSFLDSYAFILVRDRYQLENVAYLLLTEEKSEAMWRFQLKWRLRNSVGMGVNACILNQMTVDMNGYWLNNLQGMFLFWILWPFEPQFPLYLPMKIFVKIKWTAYVKPLTYSNN